MTNEAQSGRPARRTLRRPLSLATSLAALTLLASLVFAPAVAPWLLRFDHWTADWRTAYLSPAAAKPHPRIAIVAITDETLKDLPSSPIDRGLLARLVDAIDAAGPRAIGVDIFFLKKTEEAKDEALIAALRDAKAPVVLGAIDERGELSAERVQFQADFLARTGREAGYLNLRTEKDGVVRYGARAHPGSSYPKSWPRLLAEAEGMPAQDTGAPIRWTLPGPDATPAFDVILAHDLLGPSSATQAQRLSGRIVLIGGEFKQPPRDRHRIPLSVRDGNDIAGVAIHAHILAGLLNPGNALGELSPVATRLLLVVLGCAGLLLGWMFWRSGDRGLTSSTFATLLLVGVDVLLFTQFNLLMPFTLGLVAWLAGVTAGGAVRALVPRLAR